MEPITFITSFLTFYLKGEIAGDQNFIKLKIPNTFLTFIPLGAQKATVPVNQIASVDTNFKLNFKALLIGVIVAFIGLAAFGDSILLGLILTIWGVLVVLNSFMTALIINTTSGEAKLVFFIICEKAKAELAAKRINKLVSGRMNDTNVREHTERSTDRIVDAINKN